MEVLDIYNDYGMPTGKTIIRGDKSIKLDEHEHIAVAVIYIENNNGKFLMQKTSIEKNGEYSSTGGHVLSHETPIEAIKREVLEELGVNIENDTIIDLGYIIYDKPIRFMFYLKKDINISDVIVQQEEVDYVKYMSVDEIKDLIKNKEITQSHGIIFEKVMEYKKRF